MERELVTYWARTARFCWASPDLRWRPWSLRGQTLESTFVDSRVGDHHGDRAERNHGLAAASASFKAAVAASMRSASAATWVASISRSLLVIA